MRVFALSCLLLCAALVTLAAPAPAGADGFADLTAAVEGPADATADTDLTFTITVTNGGPDDADTVNLANAIPADTTFVSLTSPGGVTCSTPAVGATGTVSCDIPALAASASAAFTLVVHVNPGTATGTFITDVATVTTASATNPDPNDENNQGSATVQVGPVVHADMAVTKTGPEAVAADTDITYTITVTNNGPDAADVTLTDDLTDSTFVSLTQDEGPAMGCVTPVAGSTGTVTCTLDPLAAGVPVKLTLVGHVPAAAVIGEFVDNSATVATGATDSTDENDTSSTSAIVGSADLSVSATGPATANPGSSLTYPITFTNDGPDAATAAKLTIPMPGSTSFTSFTQNTGPAFTLTTPAVGGTGTVTATIASLAANASATFTLVLTVDAATPDNTSITTNFTGSSAIGDADPTDNSDSVTTLVTVPGGGGGGGGGGGSGGSGHPVAGSTPTPTPTPTVTATVQPTVTATVQPTTTPTAKPTKRRVICASVPNLAGKTFRQAKRTLARRGCKVKLGHKGRKRRHGKRTHVTKQSVKPGKTLRKGDTLRVTLH